MSTEWTALTAALVCAALFTFGTVGSGVQDFADAMFKDVGAAQYNDFSAKFVKAP